MKHKPVVLTGAVNASHAPSQPCEILALTEFQNACERIGGKKGQMLGLILQAAKANLSAGQFRSIRVADLISPLDAEQRLKLFGHQYDDEIETHLAAAVAKYRSDYPIEFADSDWHVDIKYQPGIFAEPGGSFDVTMISVVATARTPLQHRSKPGLGYAFHVKKRRQLHTLDRFSLMRGIYIFAGVTIVNLAVIVIVGISIKLISIAYLTPAAYALYYIYSEALFLSSRVKIEYNIFNQTNKLKVMTYSEDGGQLLVRRGTITANCPLCAGTMALSRNPAQYNGRIISRCSRNPTEHVYSFDPVSLTGQFLN